MPNQDKKKTTQDRDEVLKRMLKMKPKPHQASEGSRAKMKEPQKPKVGR